MSVKCSNISRCNTFKLLQIEDILLCQSCNSISKRGTKFLKKIFIHCCKNQIINHRTNIPYCINCNRFVYVNCYI